MSGELMTAYEAAAAMLDAMSADGIVPRNPGEVVSRLQCGKLVRFPCEGERAPNGWARLYLDGCPAGAFGNWRLGIDGRWKAGGYTPAARPDWHAIAARKAAEREAEQVRHIDAAHIAAVLWRTSKPAEQCHPYLVKKQLDPCNLRQDGKPLLVPMRDVSGQLWNLQRIFPDGVKMFLAGARTDSLMWRAGFAAEGTPEVIAIGEGFATSAAIYRATALPTVAAMTAGNLEPVAVEVARAFPRSRLIVCADMDMGPKGNTGLVKANAAARAAGGMVTQPPHPPGWPEGKSFDFADTWKLPNGSELIRRALGIARY